MATPIIDDHGREPLAKRAKNDLEPTTFTEQSSSTNFSVSPAPASLQASDEVSGYNAASPSASDVTSRSTAATYSNKATTIGRSDSEATAVPPCRPSENRLEEPNNGRLFLVDKDKNHEVDALDEISAGDLIALDLGRLSPKNEPNNAAKKPPPPPTESTKKKDGSQTDPFLLGNKDIWMAILSFVGPGHFAYVAGVNRPMKEWYTASIDAIGEHPKVYLDSNRREWFEDWEARTATSSRPATSSYTFYSAAFSTVACAKYWKESIMPHNQHLEDHNVCSVVAKYGNLEVLKWARQQGFGWNGETCMEAAQNGHLEVLKYAHDNHCPWDGYTCQGAAEHGQLECLKYAHENKCGWLDQPDDVETCQKVAGNGHLEILKYLHENGCPWDPWTCSEAARFGQLACLQYAHEKGCEWLEETCDQAAGWGHLKCLQYAHDNGCPWNTYTCAWAAEDGYLECLKYAHDNGCQWDAKTCKAAAEHGHFECLKYARDNGCPWDKSTYHMARENGHDEIAEWAKNNGCPVDD